MKTLYIFRGLPGSGKSTAARKLAKEKIILHYETDMFFEKDGVYKFDGAKIGEAHEWCQNSVRSVMESGSDIIVSNTFTLLWQLLPYFDMALEFNYYVEVVEMRTQYASIHNIPASVFEKMKDRFVPIQLLPYYDHVRYTSVNPISI